MKVSFLGDIAFNGDYIELYKKKQNPFERLKENLFVADYVIGNLECMAKGNTGENLKKRPRLTSTYETLNFLKNINLNIACLAQNHIYDHLEDGFAKTVDFLENNQIKYLGASNEQSDIDKSLILEKGGVKIGLLNYVTFDTNPNIPDNAGVYLNFFDIEKCKTDIRKIKSTVDHVVLSLHWGGKVEGGFYPDSLQQQIGRALIDNGADLIIGHHSHTVQPFEKYRGKYIFYSLGNFCFSDFWFEDRFYFLPKRRKITLILDVYFSKKSYNIKNSFYQNKIIEFKKIDYIQFKIRNILFRFLFRYKPFFNVYRVYFLKIEPVFLFFNRSDIKLSMKINRLLKFSRKKIIQLFKF
jgi:hypothetical protein